MFASLPATTTGETYSKIPRMNARIKTPPPILSQVAGRADVLLPNNQTPSRELWVSTFSFGPLWIVISVLSLNLIACLPFHSRNCWSGRQSLERNRRDRSFVGAIYKASPHYLNLNPEHELHVPSTTSQADWRFMLHLLSQCGPRNPPVATPRPNAPPPPPK